MDKNKELIEYLDGKFSHIDSRFEAVKDQFIQMESRFGKLETILENKADKSDVNTLTNAVDAYMKKADTYFQEMLILAHRVDRMEKWMKQIADKVGIKLEL